SRPCSSRTRARAAHSSRSRDGFRRGQAPRPGPQRTRSTPARLRALRPAGSLSMHLAFLAILSVASSGVATPANLGAVGAPGAVVACAPAALDVEDEDPAKLLGKKEVADRLRGIDRL